MHNKQYKQKGFSLIEAALVLVLMSIIATVFLQRKNDETKLALDEKVAQKTIEEIRNIGIAAGHYFLENNYVWPNTSGADGDNNGTPDRGCSKAIEELKNRTNPDTTATASVVRQNSYLTFIGTDSPYGSKYITRCSGGNFYVETWINNSKDLNKKGKRTNIYQAKYVSNQSIIPTATCDSVSKGNNPGDCQSIGGTNKYYDERILSVFQRPEGWFAFGQFLKTTGGVITGNIEFKNGAHINLNNNSLLNLKNGSKINLEDGSVIQAKSGSKIEIKRGATIQAQNGAQINLESGSIIQAKSGSSINLKNNSEIKLEPGSRIKLENNSKIILANGRSVSNSLTSVTKLQFTKRSSRIQTETKNVKKQDCSTVDSKIDIIYLDSFHTVSGRLKKFSIPIEGITPTLAGEYWKVTLRHSNIMSSEDAANPSYSSILSGMNKYEINLIAITYCGE